MKKQSFYTTKEILPGVYGISSSAVMCWLIVGTKGAMLVDTAYGFEDLAAEVRKTTQLPLTVVNSHGHVDHTGGNFYFDTPVCIHEADVELYKLHNTPRFHRYMEKSLRLFGRILFWKHFLPKDPERNDEQRAAFDNWRFIKEGDTFDLGGVTAQIIEIPGHTQGSVAVLFPEKRLIVTSDGANPATWLFLPESAPLSVYIHSLKKLQGFAFDTILTGHSARPVPRNALEDWLHVAQNPDLKSGRVAKASELAEAGRQVTCWATDDPRHRGPNLVLDPQKADTLF